MQAKQPSSKGLSWGLGILGGIVLSSLDQSFAGFVVGVALGVLGAQTLFLRRRAIELYEELVALRRAARDETPAASQPLPPRAETTPPPQPTPAPIPAPVVSEPISEPIGTSIRDEPVIPRAPVTSRVARREPEWTDRLISGALAWLKRGNPLARIGIVILFLGGAFLAKYAADHSMFPLELRFGLLAAGAFALVGIGWRLRTKRAVYAQVLQGGGIAGLYLTVFAAASLYHLLPLGLAFGLMVAVALAAAVIAVAQNALSLAVIGTVGGFLAPILVSTGSGNHIALFTYYAILNLGIFAVAWFRTWRVLNVLGFIFTFTITGLWRAASYGPEDLVSADLFLALFFLMYVGVSILNCVRQPPNLKGYVSGSLVFGLPVVAFTLHATLVSRIHYALAWSALATGAFYLALAWSLWRSGRETFRLLVEAFAALGIVFASLAIPLAFDTRTTAAMWAVEGAGLIWLGVRQQRKLARAFGALLQLAGGIGFLSRLDRIEAAVPILNTAFLGATMLAVAGMFSGYTLFRNQAHEACYEKGWSVGIALWATAWWLLGGFAEISRSAPDWMLGLALAHVAVASVALTILARGVAWPFPRQIGLYLPVFGALSGTILALDTHHPFAEGGVFGWVSLACAFYWMLRKAEREELVQGTAMHALHAGAALLLVVIISWEVTWQVDRHAAGVWPALPWGIVPLAALAWLARRALRPSWPVARHEDTYRMLVAAPLSVAVALWVLAVNVSNVGDPVWLPYLPLLNPLDISVALALAAGALWWTSLGDTQRRRLWSLDSRALLALVAGLVFVWLNSALIRSLHHNFGAPITPYGIMRSQFVQAALSIFWAILGFVAMTTAARRRWRHVWIVGASLMVVVVVKLFIVDLSNVGTVARIISFLTIGALLLVTGYLAPLPPKRSEVDRDNAAGESREETVNP
jgi:uncharacterized membrane protein